MGPKNYGMLMGSDRTCVCVSMSVCRACSIVFDFLGTKADLVI